MKFSELQTQVNNFLGRNAANPGLWSDAEVKDAINEALKDAEIEIDEAFEYYFLAWTVINEVEGEDVYRLPGDCKKVVSLERVVAGGVTQPYFLTKIGWSTAAEEFYRWTESLTSSVYGYETEAYQQEGSKIRLMKKSNVSSNGTLVMVYVRSLPPMVDDEDLPGIPTDYHSLLKWRSLQYLLPKEEEGGPRMAMVNRNADEKRALMLFHVRRKNLQAPKYMNFIDTGEI